MLTPVTSWSWGWASLLFSLVVVHAALLLSSSVVIALSPIFIVCVCVLLLLLIVYEGGGKSDFLKFIDNFYLFIYWGWGAPSIHYTVTFMRTDCSFWKEKNKTKNEEKDEKEEGEKKRRRVCHDIYVY